MRVVFLDRDGVINRFPGHGSYVTRVKDFRFVPGSLVAIRRLTEQGYTLVVVSNQAGVGKGVLSRSKLEQITRHMMREIARSGGRIRRVMYCTHRPDAGCDCRKPGIGSLVRAMKILKRPVTDLAESCFIGDSRSDIEAGRHAGCRTIFVLSGNETRRQLKTWRVRPDQVADDLLSAIDFIETPSPRPARRRRIAAGHSRQRRQPGKR